MFTQDLLHKVFPLTSKAHLDEMIPFLTSYSVMYHINNKLRVSNFIGQIGYESKGFSILEENLYYTTPSRIGAVWPKLKNRQNELIKNPVALANAAYADRMGNGNEASGDGWKYRGRGLIMLTGHDNYSRFGRSIDMDFVSKPELLASPNYAVRSAMLYWEKTGCNSLADLNDYTRITRQINGPGMEGLDARKALTERVYSFIQP